MGGASATARVADSYDQADEMTGSVGPTGVITDIFNLRNGLIDVQGPATNVSYVVDGGGENGLRSWSICLSHLVPALWRLRHGQCRGMIPSKARVLTMPRLLCRRRWCSGGYAAAVVSSTHRR
jgi:hypothetical protein